MREEREGKEEKRRRKGARPSAPTGNAPADAAFSAGKGEGARRGEEKKGFLNALKKRLPLNPEDTRRGKRGAIEPREEGRKGGRRTAERAREVASRTSLRSDLQGDPSIAPTLPAARRPVKRKARIRFTRRFYVLLGVTLGIILLLVLISAVRSGGGGEELGEVVKAGAGLKEGDLHRMKVNELGAVMILEYHRIAEEGRWSRTPENFRSDLEYLYEQGYRCISLEDLVTNNIDVEAGYTPVVITFDDADPSQFRYLEENGELVIDPRCAVGVMEQFAAEHPDFNMTATFLVLPVLFGQEEYKEMKLRYLVEHGYDIGNHTLNHVPLGDAEEDKILSELAGNIKLVQKYLPDYRQTSLALPLGSEPRDYSVLKHGEYEGVEINFLASLLVGANPAPAPCDRAFDPLRLPRIQALDPSLDTGDSGIYAWIQYFMENPERRYVSDGDPSTVTIPKHMEDRIDRERLGDKKLRLY